MKYNFLKVVVGLVFCHGFAFAQAVKVGTINGVEVSKDEIVREMRKYRAEVVNVVNKTGKVNSKNFWASETAKGENAITLLRNKAVESLTLIKVQEQLLRERKIWPYKSYQDLLQDMEATNLNRAKLLEQKQVLYGPVKYSEQVFFDYRFTNALILLKQKLENEKILTVSDSDLQRQFSKMQKTVYLEEKYTLEGFTRQVKEAYLEEAYAAFIQKLATAAKKSIDFKQLNKISLN